MVAVGSTLGYLIIIVLPAILYYFSKIYNKIALWPLFMIFVIPFVAAALELLGILTVQHYNLIVEFMIIILFLLSIVKRRDTKINLYGYIYVFSFVGVSIISYVVNDTSVTQLLLFFRKYIIPILFFWAVMNFKISENEYRFFNRLIMTLFVLQIPVAIGKYLIVGQAERYVGTMTVTGGSLSAIFALFGIIIYLSLYLNNKNYTYIIFILGFFLFSIVGDKRAIIVYAPIVLMTVVFFNGYKEKLTALIKRALFIVPVAFLFIFLTVSLIPILNPENKIGGSFDWEHVTNWSQGYLFPERTIAGAQYYGRGEAPIAVWNLMVIESGLPELLIGFGAGDLIMSRFVDTGPVTGRMENLIAYKHNIGYGARTGFFTIILQVGLLGAIFIFAFYGALFKRIYIIYRNNKDNHPLYVIVLSTFALFFLDTLTYSITMLELFPVVLPFIWFISQALKSYDKLDLNKIW